MIHVLAIKIHFSYIHSIILCNFFSEGCCTYHLYPQKKLIFLEIYSTVKIERDLATLIKKANFSIYLFLLAWNGLKNFLNLSNSLSLTCQFFDQIY